MNILELYSGIGGFHHALKATGISGQVVAAIEINTLANEVYRHNFPNSVVLNRNIDGLSASFLNNLNANTICMSPPCQPFTRNGLQKDVLDPRSRSFLHLLDILPDLHVDYILVENVKGFENSATRNKMVATLDKCDFVYQELILSPTQLAVPNTRHRYYCLAKRKPRKFEWGPRELMCDIPAVTGEAKACVPFPLSDIIETDCDFSEYLVGENVLEKHVGVLDICHPESRRSCCFTKAYGRFVEGTGSVFTAKTEAEVSAAFKHPDSSLIRQLELRFFTPRELARLMSFPEQFSFPEHISKQQRYKLLGNSVNVRVVSELLKILFSC